MPIDPAIENLVSFRAARSLFAQNPSLRSIQRWTRDGYNGVILETTPSAGTRVTSVEAVTRFLCELANKEK